MAAHIKLGFAPTRRAIFSAPAAVEYRNLTADRLREMNIDFVDIDDINEEGLLYDDAGLEKIIAKFQREKVDGLFLPHANFGTEYECARLAKALNVPVLLWGPRDERPDKNGMRLRDSQCGLFATGKVLRRFRVPFTYMNNCNLEDPEFERGVRDFLAVCNVVRTFHHTRILQIGPRPFDFWSTMCNEGELLEKFNVQLAPIPLPELYAEMRKWREEKTEVAKVVAYCKENMTCRIEDNYLANVAELKVAMKSLAATFRNKDFRIFVASDIIYFLGITMFQTALPYFVKMLLGIADEGMYTVYFVLMTALSVLFYPLVNKLTPKTGKKKLILIAFGIFTVAFSFTACFGKALPFPAEIQGYILCALAAPAMAIFGILPQAVVADIAECDALETKENRSGMFYAARTFAMKMGQAVAMLLVTSLGSIGRETGLGYRIVAICAAAVCVLGGVLFLLYNESKVYSKIARE